MADSPYIHGTDADEQRRLSVMNDWINGLSLAELRLPADRPVRVLDVGSGLGQLTRAIARSAAAGSVVVGVERDPEQLERAKDLAAAAGEARLVDFRAGDATDLPLTGGERASFDVVHTRFLLEHVPDPSAVVRAMVAAARPAGGRIVLEDDDHDLLRLDPEPPGFTALWSAYQRVYTINRNDPIIGRRLVRLLRDAGARPARNALLFFGSCAGHDTWHTAVRNLVGVLRSAERRMIDGGLISPAGARDAFAAVDRWEARDDAAIWYAISWAEGVRP